MPNGRDKGVRAYHYIVADTDFPDVEDSQIIVPGKVVADIDVLAVVAVEGLGNPYLVTLVTEVFREASVLRLIVRIVNGIVFTAEEDGPLFEGLHFRIIVAVLQSCLEFFQLCYRLI